MGTITIIEPKDKIPSSIRSYVAKQLPDYEIQSCRMISNPNEKPYYNTVLYDKNKNQVLILTSLSRENLWNKDKEKN